MPLEDDVVRHNSVLTELQKSAIHARINNETVADNEVILDSGMLADGAEEGTAVLRAVIGSHTFTPWVAVVSR